MEKENKEKRITIRIEQTLYDKIEQSANENMNDSVSKEIRNIIQRYFEIKEKMK